MIIPYVIKKYNTFLNLQEIVNERYIGFVAAKPPT